MNRQEIIAVVLLFAALMGWMFYFGQPTVPEPAEPGMEEAVVEYPAVRPELLEADDDIDVPDEVAAAAPVDPVAELPPEQIWRLGNDLLEVNVSSRGGAVTRVVLSEFYNMPDQQGGAVEFDFSDAAALAITDWPQFGDKAHFSLVEHDPSGGRLLLERNSGAVTLRRELILNGYSIALHDVFNNNSTGTVALAQHGIKLGYMPSIQSGAGGMGAINYLSADSQPVAAGRKTRHYSKRVASLFGASSGFMNCGAVNPAGLPLDISHNVDEPVRWVSAKNKFFAQVLRPEEPGRGYRVNARRADDQQVFFVEQVGALIKMDAAALAAGEELAREYLYYVGPKEYSRLRAFPDNLANVMEFGFFGPLCRLLLPALNFFYSLVRNYGVAIILLTIVVRVIFWPVTRKSTESMKKMAEIQPEVQKLREKYKKDPQQMNQAVMLLYRERGVNPLAGCLPMVIQIPVFIALFTVLRSAVELRFAPFLWISDLSEPEGLLEGMIPLAGSLNILPLFMTATMVWQQKLTPTAGDPQQQKMMMIMPVVMLFIFYNMPSALVLYWSTSQCLSIAQLLLQQRKQKAAGKA